MAERIGERVKDQEERSVTSVNIRKPNEGAQSLLSIHMVG
jgi:hypothetical protein